MRFAVQRGGVWLSHSYEMGYGCRILTQKKKKNGQICAATVKKEKKNDFLFQKM